jgi:type I restriction enzyme, S subunit
MAGDFGRNECRGSCVSFIVTIIKWLLMASTNNNNQNDFGLPNGWLRVKLGEVCEFEYGKSLTKNSRYENGEFPVYGSNGIVGYHNEYLVPAPSIIVGRKGAAGEIHFSDKPCFPIDTTYYIHQNHINPKFLYYQLKTLGLTSLDRSTAIPGLNRTDAYQRLFNLAPFGEQHRIAEKIERLFARLSRAEAALAAAETALERYRQSVLNTAFKAEDEEGNLKEGWKWVKLGEWAEIKGGKRLPSGKNYVNEKTQFPYIRVTDFENMTINENNLKYLDFETQKAIKNYTINQNDLYISIAGTIGRVGKVPANLSGANLTENAAKITSIKGFDLDFLCFALNGSVVQYQIYDFTISTTQPKLALFRIEKLTLPQPPIEDQKQIVSQIKSSFSKSFTLISQIEQLQTECTRLRQSILQAAFSGQLVPQNTRDEPAEVLLQRIRASRQVKETMVRRKQKA